MDHPQDLAPPVPSPISPLAYERLRQMVHFQAGFLGTASHELRAPINRIISLHQLILEDLCESPAEERDFLAQAHQAIYQVLKNLDLLIQVSKLTIGAVQPQLYPIPLNMVFSNVQALMEMKCLNRHCRFILSPPSPELLVLTDIEWLKQLLILLVDGALVAGSTMATLSAEISEAESTVAITFGSDSSITLWQEPGGQEPGEQEPGAATGSPEPETEIDPTKLASAELSPGFRFQLATLMISNLQGTLTSRPTEDGGTEMIISVPHSA
jgi:signal transduction histidine kinase